MSSRPRADELLAAIGELLEAELMPVVPAELQHQVRVAANLVQILMREWQLGPELDEREYAALRALVGADMGIEELRSALDGRLKADQGTPAELDVLAWRALMPVMRAELAISKPGHDRWQGE
jgi:hypothetical protein